MKGINILKSGKFYHPRLPKIGYMLAMDFGAQGSNIPYLQRNSPFFAVKKNFYSTGGFNNINKDHPLFQAVLNHPDLLAELKKTFALFEANGVSKSSLASLGPIETFKLLNNNDIRSQLQKIDGMLKEKDIKVDYSTIKSLFT